MSDNSEPIRFGNHAYEAASHWRVRTLTLAPDEHLTRVIQYHMDGVKLRGIEFETNRGGRRFSAGAVHPDLEPGRPHGDRRLTKQTFDAPLGEAVVALQRKDDTGHDQWPGCGMIERVSFAPVPAGDGDGEPAAAGVPAAAGAAGGLELSPERVCVVCMDAESTAVFLPCAHRCTCSECAVSLRECPLCRTPVARMAD